MITGLTRTDGSIKDAGLSEQFGDQLEFKAPLLNPVFTGTVGGITKAMVGLGSVDNTGDSAKPVSTATETALNLKANRSGDTFSGSVTFSAGATVTGTATATR